MAIIVSTKINLLLTAAIDRVRNFNIFAKKKGFLRTISNEEKVIIIRQQAGNPTTIELTPGLALINGVIVEVNDIEELNLLGLPDGDYDLIIRVVMTDGNATASFVAQVQGNTINNDDFTELENGNADLVVATVTMNAANVVVFTPVPEYIKTFESIAAEHEFLMALAADTANRLDDLEELHNDSGWIDLTYATGFSPRVPGATAQYRILNDILYLRGTVQKDAGTFTGVYDSPFAAPIDFTGYIITGINEFDSARLLTGVTGTNVLRAYISSDGFIRIASNGGSQNDTIYAVLNMVLSLDKEV